MKDVVVDKCALLNVLRKNRAEHSKIFLEAQVGYRKLAIEQLDSMLADAKAGKNIRKTVTLVDPVDQTNDYDRAIKMLEMSLEDKITLSERDFACYVLDQWAWKQQFTASNYAYSDTLKSMMPMPSE